jgi:hypothetical protein
MVSNIAGVKAVLKRKCGETVSPLYNCSHFLYFSLFLHFWEGFSNQLFYNLVVFTLCYQIVKRKMNIEKKQSQWRQRRNERQAKKCCGGRLATPSLTNC